MPFDNKFCGNMYEYRYEYVNIYSRQILTVLGCSVFCMINLCVSEGISQINVFGKKGMINKFENFEAKFFFLLFLV